MTIKSVVISPGHGLKIRGARGNPVPPQLDEVDAARRIVKRVVELFPSVGVKVQMFQDDVSTTQDANLKWLVGKHNGAGKHDLDVSVHLNAYNGSAHGTECLYVTQQSLSSKLASAMSSAAGTTNRGPKKRTDLYWLNNTAAPAVLLELVFCDNTSDCNKFNQHFEKLCTSIVEAISGQNVQPVPPEPPIDPPPDPGPDPEPPTPQRPTISKGAKGPDVRYLQEQLNSDNNAGLTVDGDFGSRTDSAVRGYQASRNLDVDGIVGPQTWQALDFDAPPYVPPGLPPALTDEDINAICDIAMASDIADYNWKSRGMAPPGYTKGFALSFANVYRKLLVGHAAATEMAKRRNGSNSKDVLQVYKSDFERLGMNNESDGPDTLLHYYALLLGQGMRESSGRHCEGRDMSASNVTSDTAEAGLMQTSYNASAFSPNFDKVMDEYAAGGGNNPQAFLNTFAEGVYCNSSSWACYGSGRGYQFQKMAKEMPAFAVETCALVARNRCDHYGPLIRKECELKAEAAEMLRAVRHYIDTNTPSA